MTAPVTTPDDDAGGRRRSLIGLGVLILVPPALCWPLLVGLVTADPAVWTSHLAFAQPGADLLIPGYPGWADGNAGVTTEALGGLAASDWLQGKIPWWNPYSGIGLPLAAEQQNSALFLPFVLLLALGNGVLILKLALQVVAGLASFGLLRSLGLPRSIALTGGLLAELNGTFAWYSHGPIMPVAFLPLLLLGIERCRLSAAGRTSGFGAPLVAVAIAMSLLAGFPETAYLDGWLGLVWFAVRLAATGGWRPAIRFAGPVTAGGVAGLLLAAPALVTFVGSLPLSYLSQHVDFDAEHLLRPNLLMLVLPYAYGPILFGSASGVEGPEIWWHAGGFVGLPLAGAAAAAIVSALRRGDVRERGLRWTLCLWLLATGLKAVGWRPAVAAFDLIPFVRQSLFHVYILPSWEIGSIVLAAFCLEDVRLGRLRASTAWLVGACVGAYLTLALRWAWPWLIALGAHARGIATTSWLPCAVELSLGALLLVALPQAARARMRALPLAVLVAAACIDYAFPLLSAATPRPLDLAPVRWLRSHLGNDRFYSEYLLQPNTAARYRVGSVNHIYLPVPANWVGYLHRNLNPAMDGVTFFGNDLRATETGGAELGNFLHPPSTIAHAVDVLEGLSVRYVAVPHGVDPFEDTVGPELQLGTRSPFQLTGTNTATATVRSPALREQDVTQVGLELGTYAGQAGGTVVAVLCTAAECATARAPVAGAADNAVAWLSLDRPLPVGGAGAVTVTVHAEGPANRPALWESPCADRSCSTSPVAILRFRPIAVPVVPVYADRLVDIFPLPDPAPYLSTVAGRCRLDVRSREDVTAVCTAADTLVRRELFYPGWRARIGSRRLPLAAADRIFQSVRLPAGRSDVTFRYRPPGEKVIVLGLVLGTMLIAFLLTPMARLRFSGDRPKEVAAAAGVESAKGQAAGC